MVMIDDTTHSKGIYTYELSEPPDVDGLRSAINTAEWGNIVLRVVALQESDYSDGEAFHIDTMHIEDSVPAIVVYGRVGLNTARIDINHDPSVEPGKQLLLLTVYDEAKATDTDTGPHLRLIK